MYKIIGIDGKEYGPATAEQIRLWIRDRRVDRHTRVFAQDATDWTPACLVPEFASEFPDATLASTTPASAAPPAVPPVTPPPVAQGAPGSIAPPYSVQSSGNATAGMVFGILSVTVGCCCGGLPFNILGLIFSIIALVQISEDPVHHGGRGRATHRPTPFRPS